MTISSRLPGLAALTGAVALAATAVSAASAQEQRPVPTSCAGVTATDQAGDAHLTTSPVAGVGPGQANLDIQRVFFRYAPGPDGKNVLTGNIEVTNLDTTIPPGAQAVAWDLVFTLGDAIKYAKAKVGSDGQVAFDYGTRANPSTSEGETTGKLHLGEKGVVEIVLPVDKLQLGGKTLNDVYATAGYVQGSGPSATFFQDRAPDGTEYGQPFKVTPCAEAGTPTPVQPTGPGGQLTPGGQQQAPGQQQSPGQHQNPAAAGTLDLKVLAGKISARKVQKKRMLSIRLQAGEPLRDLKATLLKGSRKLATATVTKVSPGNATLKFKLTKTAVRKIKRGTYTLAFTAQRADGSSGSGSVQLSLKK